MRTEILYEDNSVLVIRKPAGLAGSFAPAGGGCAGIRQREKVGSSSDETIVGGHIE